MSYELPLPALGAVERNLRRTRQRPGRSQRSSHAVLARRAALDAGEDFHGQIETKSIECAAARWNDDAERGENSSSQLSPRSRRAPLASRRSESVDPIPTPRSISARHRTGSLANRQRRRSEDLVDDRRKPQPLQRWCFPPLFPRLEASVSTPLSRPPRGCLARLRRRPLERYARWQRVFVACDAG